ncbi:MAG: energy-coupling factor transporter transmembrane protein EcfT [Candidatus Marinimicrobia bacterium]|nr:energy-coupling factor transporter transmembrane protein EcfT [Candidatus Neomarinimicrobiota bacterium]MCF7829699.1 energy-coupling factor transporter transmembrane protein EcfT [Candidatus Neomarinimicrobiota bacterium]MCF7881649.1 energy-coupling factor transporter transmembrane protein EcfT [Candidatus Neomarinimicrobiota bacterium]
MPSHSDTNQKDLRGFWHPLVVIIAVGVLGGLIAASRQLPHITIFLILSIAGFRFMGAPIHRTIRTIRYFFWLLPLTFIMHLVLTPSGWAFFSHLWEGALRLDFLDNPFSFTLQIFGFLYIMGSAYQLVSGDRLIVSLGRLLSPARKLRIPVDSLFQIVYIALRFIPLLREEAIRIQEVRRGFGVSGNEKILEKARSQMHGMVPLFIGTLHRAEVVAQLMTLRGFRPGEQRSSYIEVTWHARDILTILGFIALFGGSILLL